MSDQKSEADSVAQLVKAANTPILNVPAQGLAIFPNGTVKNLDDERLLAFPRRKRANIRLCETYSFIQYLIAQKENGTLILGQASETGGSFKAIIDYHNSSQDGSADWGEHICELFLQTTPEWNRWIAKDRSPMTQEQFAEFIEENMGDIIAPEAATILDMAQFLQGKKTVDFKAGKRLKDGQISLEYIETIAATGGRTSDSTSIPDGFTLGIVPFIGGDGVELDARLRFRIGDGGKVTFSYVLDRPYKVIEKAFEMAREAIKVGTNITPLMGIGMISPPPIIAL